METDEISKTPVQASPSISQDYENKTERKSEGDSIKKEVKNLVKFTTLENMDGILENDDGHFMKSGEKTTNPYSKQCKNPKNLIIIRKKLNYEDQLEKEESKEDIGHEGIEGSLQDPAQQLQLLDNSKITLSPLRNKQFKQYWTKEEDDKLHTLVSKHGAKNWKRIASYFSNRTDVQCLHRWQKVLNPDLVKGPWTVEEDEKVRVMVKRYGAKNWSAIANHLPGRIGKQ